MHRNEEPAYRRPKRRQNDAPGRHAGWDGILDPGEKILWQGQPARGIALGAEDIALMVFGTFFAGFALFWMVMAAQGGGLFWTFGLLHFAVGAGILLWPVAGKPFRRAHTWYTLTDRRAFIGRDLPLFGKSLDSYPIGAETDLTLMDGTPGTVLFATRQVRGKRGYRTVPVGFERIDDVRAVYALIRGIQRSEDTTP